VAPAGGTQGAQREFVAAWDALRETRPMGDFTRLLRKIEVYTGMAARVNADAEDESAVLLNEGPMGVNDARAALVLRDNVGHRHDIERAYLKAWARRGRTS
jgi:cardiolipin synthase A/B